MGLGRCGGGAAAGEREEQPFQLSFNGRLKVDFQRSRVTSDGGLLLVRELDERLGFGALAHRTALGRPPREEHPVAADRPRAAIGIQPTGGLRGCQRRRAPLPRPGLPAHRLREILERGATLTSRLQAFETELLTQAENLAGLAGLNRELVAKGEIIASPRRVCAGHEQNRGPGLRPTGAVRAGAKCH
jgi:hypothetical protein